MRKQFVEGGPWPGPPFWLRGGRMGFGFPGAWRGAGHRARRGHVRAAILILLAERPMHGYQIIQELEARSGGAWHPSPGSIYPTLQLLQDEGLLASEEVEGKRVFSLTEAGKARVEEHGSEAPPWAGFTEGAEEVVRLREAFFQLGAATMQVAQTASKTQAEEALEVLKGARKRLYGILAEEA